MPANPNEGKHPIQVQAEAAAAALDLPISQAAAAALAAADNGLRFFQTVKTAAVSPLAVAPATGALPNARPTSTYALVGLVGETVTAPTAVNVTVKVGYTPAAGAFTAMLTKVVPLGSFAAVNNAVNILGITATAAALPRWPAGAIPQVMASDGTFNFVGQFVEIPVVS